MQSIHIGLGGGINERGEGGLSGDWYYKSLENYHEILSNFVYQEMKDKMFTF